MGSDGHTASCDRGNRLCLAVQRQQRHSHPWHNNTQPHHHGNSVGCKSDLSRPWPCPLSLFLETSYPDVPINHMPCSCFFFSHCATQNTMAAFPPQTQMAARWTTDGIVMPMHLNTGLWDWYCTLDKSTYMLHDFDNVGFHRLVVSCCSLH